MRTRVQAFVLPVEASDFADELRSIYVELGHGTGSGMLAGECSPPLDVYETDDTIEIAMDVPGVLAADIRVLAKGNVILIAGEKAPRRGQGDASFHLVERGFGRFARTVTVTAACDIGRATGHIREGELRISIPKTRNRRGQIVTIPIGGDPPRA
jgi:HSP20 family protein